MEEKLKLAKKILNSTPIQTPLEEIILESEPITVFQPHVIVEANISAGKTTLISKIEQERECIVYEEPVEENIFLNDFLKNNKRYAIQMEMFLNLYRLEQHHSIMAQRKILDKHKVRELIYLQDRSIYSNIVFVETMKRLGTIDTRDELLFKKHYDLLVNKMQRPDVIIYLKNKPENSYVNIARRNRFNENKITLGYLETLSDEYDLWITAMKEIGMNILYVEYDNFTPVEIILNGLDMIFTSMKEGKKLRNIVHINSRDEIKVL